MARKYTKKKKYTMQKERDSLREALLDLMKINDDPMRKWANVIGISVITLNSFLNNLDNPTRRLTLNRIERFVRYYSEFYKANINKKIKIKKAKIVEE